MKALTGADQLIYVRKGDTRGRVAPDVFVLPGVAPDHRVTSWKVWVERVVPSFALEIVSKDVDKDYIDGPAFYRELGVRELFPTPEEERDRERGLRMAAEEEIRRLREENQRLRGGAGRKR